MKKIWKREKQTAKNFQQQELQVLLLKFILIQTKHLNNYPIEPKTRVKIKTILLEQLSKLSRKASITRLPNACPFTGRVRGFYNFAKMSRMEFKSLAGAGVFPGIRKASW